MARGTRNRTRDERDRRVDLGAGGIRVHDARYDVGVGEARRRFGGIDVRATLVGMLTALAFLVLFAGLVGAAIGAIGYQKGLSGTEDRRPHRACLGLRSGRLDAGRIARYDGPLNGAMTGVWTLILAAILAGLGAWLGSEYNVFRNVELPQWFPRDALTAGAIVSGVVAVAGMLLAGALGGAWGERFHRRADATIATTRPGGVEVGATRR
jgi:hypothetical protein